VVFPTAAVLFRIIASAALLYAIGTHLLLASAAHLHALGANIQLPATKEFGADAIFAVALLAVAIASPNDCIRLWILADTGL